MVKLSIVLLFISSTAGETDAVDKALDYSLSTRFVAGSGAFFRVRGACPPFVHLDAKNSKASKIFFP